MRIDLATLAFGYKVASGGNTPNWGTCLGQNREYKINENAEIDKLLRGMVYKSVPNEKVKMRLGRGGAFVTGNAEDSRFVLASVFSKVFVNETLIENNRLGLVIIKERSDSHNGRLTLKYSDSITYTDGDETYVNETFYKQVPLKLGLAEDACWFVKDITVRNQDELLLNAVIVDGTGSVTYEDRTALRNAWLPYYAYDNNENAFKEWFKEQTYADGKSYSENTQAKYIGALKNASSKLKVKLVPYESIFNVNDVVELERVADIIRNDEHGTELMAYGSNSLMPCIELYRKFLEIKDGIQPVLKYNTDVTSEYPLNRIIFGAPGTGKSYLLNKEQIDLLNSGGSFERVTFHADYTYANFVGAYKPVADKDENGADIITYKYVPGPFTRMLVKALSNPKCAHLLLIEEINRANVAAVFGDIFQLLDRDASGVSEYEIQTSEDMRKYLAEELKVKLDDVSNIKIPNNLYIWATMNSADQGVYPMDTAFKRRWDFEYIDINNSEKEVAHYWFEVAGEKYHWNSLRQAINYQLTQSGVNEDKLMGAFFVAKSIIDSNDNEKFVKALCNKVIMYLFEDAARQKHSKIFELKDIKVRYSELCATFSEQGIKVFNSEVVEKYNNLVEKVEKPVEATEEAMVE